MRRFTILSLKSVNLIITTLNAFAIIFVLVRVVSTQLYPLLVIASSIGGYVLASDLGYTAFVYSHVRQLYLTADARKINGFISDAVTGYTFLAVAASLMATFTIFFSLKIPFNESAGIAIYFVSIVIALPWSILRKAAAAVDLYITFEVIELIRRALLLSLTLLMLLGLSFYVFGVLILFLWFATIATCVFVFSKQGIEINISSLTRVFSHISKYKGTMLYSSLYSLLEFALYNYPYLITPFVFKNATTVVVFDVFYKVVRFGGSAFSVSADTFLIFQTRAFYEGRKDDLKRLLGLSFLVGTIPLMVAGAFIFVYGDQFFKFLISRAGRISPTIQYTMIGMLAAMLIQNTVGGFLVGLGRYKSLGRAALGAVAVSGLFVIFVIVLRIGFEQMMFGYVLIYSIYAFALIRLASRITR